MEFDYPFIYDDVFLTALINEKTNKQFLVLKQIDLKTGEVIKRFYLYCIHTAIYNTNIEDLIKYNTEDLVIRSFEIVSLENRNNEIFLSLEERIFAFKSWVEGISNFGIKSLEIQSEIENYYRFIVPISSFLLKSLSLIKEEFFYEFVNFINKQSVYENVKSQSYIDANFITILQSIDDNSEILTDDKYEKLKYAICILKPSIFVFFEKDNYKSYLRKLIKRDIEIISELPQFPILFKISDLSIKIQLANNEYATNFNEFKFLFDENNDLIKVCIASNKGATKFNEYRTLFNEKNRYILSNIASNLLAVKFDEYRNLFYVEDPFVLMYVAKNPNAVNFEEYKKLFNIDNILVKRFIASNPNATKFEEYKKFFYDNDVITRIFVAENINATKFDDYNILFNDNNMLVKMAIASNPNIIKFKDKINLLINDKNECIKKILNRIN